MIRRKGDGWFTDAISQELGSSIARTLKGQLGDERPAPRLRLSQMGARCPRALWYSIHRPELAEPLPPWAEVKYSYGHIIEALTITLIKASGHTVTGEQDELTADGVVGHRDCVVDGCICDIKSTSSRGFGKFKNGTLGQDDPFGYLEQLDGYLLGSIHDDLVQVKDKAYILAVDKTLGHMALYEHTFREEHIRKRIADYKEIVGRSEPPACTCGTEPDGSSGNVRLDLRASYSPYKYCCFPNLRTFLYAKGPVYLTKVVRQPYDFVKRQYIQEIDKNGKVIYNG